MKKIAIYVWAFAMVCAAPAAAQGRDPAYRVGPRDLIDVKVFEDDKINGQRRVSENGTISLPLLNDVAVAARVQQGGKIPEIEQILSTGAAAQNIMLAAHALGYGAMWKTGDPAYDPRVKRALGLEESDVIVAFLYLGTNTGPARPAGNRPAVADFLSEWRG